MDTPSFCDGSCLSIGIVALNNPPDLAETIQSVRPLVDQIVVLAAGSTEQIMEIGKAEGVRLIQYEWQHDYSAARNHLLARLTSHWVLWLEPGERLEPQTAAQLKYFLDTQANQNTVYRLLVELEARSQDTGAEQIAQLRLLPNRPELRYEGRVRETVKPAIQKGGLNVALAPGRILRPAGWHDPQRKSARAWLALDLAALETNLEGSPSLRALLAMGEAALDLEDWALARQAFSEAVRTAPKGSLELLEGYYGLLASLEGEPSDAPRRLPTCLEALEAFPFDAQLLCMMGTYLQSQNHLDLAIRAFETAVRYGQVNLETWHLTEIDRLAVAYLSLALQLKGDWDRARQVVEEGLGRFPDSVRLRRQLVQLHIQAGRTEEALAAAQGLPCEPARKGLLEQAIRGACRAATQDWTPALAYLQSAYVAGCEDPICLRWLAVVLLSTGQLESVEPVLRRWQRVEPNNAEVRMYLNALCQQAPEAQTPAPEQPSAASADQWHRIDPGTSSLHTSCWPSPIVTQASTDSWG